MKGDIMDKINEKRAAHYKIWIAELINKVNELVGGYNEIMKRIDDNTEWISKHLDIHEKYHVDDK